jgi:membrane-associated protein
MNSTSLALLPGWLDPSNLIQGLGSWAVVGILLIIFAECGILIGFFLPGDTLLFLAGLLVASAHKGQDGIDINLWLFVALLAVAAFVGNVVGYWIGYKVGPPVFNRPDAKLLKHEHIEKSAAFFEKYGKITVVLARFVPIVRTVATVMAGASRMNRKIYLTYSAIGGLLWVTVVTLAGYFLGQIPWVADNVDLIFIAAAAVVVAGIAAPGVLHLLQRRKVKRSTPPIDKTA